LSIEVNETATQLARVDVCLFGKYPGTLGPFLHAGDSLRGVKFDGLPIRGFFLVEWNN